MLIRNGKKGSGFGAMDALNYTYQGNRLMRVEDGYGTENYEVDFINRNIGSDDYSYYPNGSLQKDLNEGITNITYNTLFNQPEEITLTGSRWIKYTYDGAGALLRTEYSNGEIWEYADAFVFKNNSPFQFSIPDGRAIFESGGWNCEFNYKDHLGNTRTSFKAGASGLVQTAKTDFDPWGVRLNGTGMENTQQNRFELQGKESEKTFRLNRINFGARTYNPTIGKWDSVDPLASKLPSWSPYAYCLNNPILMVDPDGAYPWPVHVRSFISTPTKGGGLFYGDGRGASFTGTSRVYSAFTVDPSARTVSQPVTKSDPTIFFGIPGQLPPIVKTGKPTGSNDNISFSGNTASFDFSHSGKDPITPQFATPALDVHAGLSFTEDLKNGVLNVTGSFTGDKFPSTEAFITDQSGKTKLFLGATMEKGGVGDLYGDNKENLFKVNMQIKFDDKGNFKGVQQGKTTYTVADWNKKVQEEFKK